MTNKSIASKVKKSAISTINKISKPIATFFKKDNNKTVNKNVLDNSAKGFVYLTGNKSIPFAVKCGETHVNGNIEKRMKQLSGTSVPTEFVPIAVVECNNWCALEKEMHQKFAKYRINQRREFFGFNTDIVNSSYDEIQRQKIKYERLEMKMIKKLYKYAKKYNGKIVI